MILLKMLEPSFGAVNLEDISQPNCYKVLDTLREECDIPVWHDDAQGTGCVTVAGLVNALKVAGKAIDKVKIVMLGAGASNTTIARLILRAGADPTKMSMFDSKGGLHKDREDIKADKAYYRKCELCEATNPEKIRDIETAMKGADVLIALSRPGPDVVKPAWIKSMGRNQWFSPAQIRCLRFIRLRPKRRARISLQPAVEGISLIRSTTPLDSPAFSKARFWSGREK